MMHVDPEGRPVVEPPDWKRWAYFLVGVLLLSLTYQLVVQEEDVRVRSAMAAGSLIAFLVWVAQLRARRVRWWRTSLAAGSSAMVVAPLVHVVLGGDPSLAAEVAAGSGVGAALIVAAVPTTGLHLVGHSLGWGRGYDRGDQGDSGDEGGATEANAAPGSDDAQKAEQDEVRSDGDAPPSTRLEVQAAWFVGIGITMVAGWRAAGWQGVVGIDRLVSAVTYPAWVFALVGTFLWWSRRTRGYIPIVMAALSIVVAWGHFVMASERNAETFVGSEPPSEVPELPETRSERARRLLEAEVQRLEADSTP